MEPRGGRINWPPSRVVLVYFVAATVYGVVNGILAALDHHVTTAVVSAVYVVAMIVGCVLAVRARARRASDAAAGEPPKSQRR